MADRIKFSFCKKKNLVFATRLVLSKIRCAKTNALIIWPLQTRPNKQKQINTQGLIETKLIEKMSNTKEQKQIETKNIEDFFPNTKNECAAIVISAFTVVYTNFSSLYTHLQRKKSKIMWVIIFVCMWIKWSELF